MPTTASWAPFSSHGTGGSLLSPLRVLPSIAAAALVAVAISCAASARPTTYIAPSDATIVGETRDSPDRAHQDIFVTNRSSAPIVITTIILSECDNLSPDCGTKPVRRLVSPLQRVLLITVGPKDPSRWYTFRYSWTWEIAH